MSWDLYREEFGVVKTYTPSWTGSTSNPTLGNGTIYGKYVLTGKLVNLVVRINMASTTTYGSGTYFVSLPLTADSSAPGLLFAGTCWLYEAGVANRHGFVRLSDTTKLSLWAHYYASVPGYGYDVSVTPTIPHTWGDGDRIEAHLAYFIP